MSDYTNLSNLKIKEINRFRAMPGMYYIPIFSNNKDEDFTTLPKLFVEGVFYGEWRMDIVSREYHQTITSGVFIRIDDNCYQLYIKNLIGELDTATTVKDILKDRTITTYDLVALLAL